MKTLIETTTGNISASLILDHCGDYAGKFQDEAYDILGKITDMPEFEGEQWADIMFDKMGKVYAVWADGALTSFHSNALYIELDREDCPRAFDGMEEKMP